MMRFDPFRDIEELTQRLDRAFYGSQGNGQGARFAPPVDVHEDEQGLELTLDLPGVQPDAVQIEAENQTLTIQAERKYERKDGRTAHRVERASGTFFRTFSVPAKYDLSKVEASFEHGTLTLNIPRSEASQRRTIPVNSGAVRSGSASSGSTSGQQKTIEAESRPTEAQPPEPQTA
jgi:HSP20 family protein